MSRSQVFRALLGLVAFVGLLTWTILSATRSSPKRPNDHDALTARRTTIGNGAVAGDTKERQAIRGFVRDADGRPVLGAEVSLHRVDASGREVSGEPVMELAGSLMNTKTSLGGAFQFVFPGMDRLVVSAHKEGLASASVFVEENELAELVLLNLVTCDVVVSDESERPIESAELWVFERGDDRPPQSVSKTDGDGRARLAVIPEGWISVRALGFATMRVEMPGTSKDPEPLRIIMAEGRRISGTVVSSSGTPLQGVLVGLRGSLENEERTDSSGRFSFDGVDPSPESDPWLVARLDGWATERPAVVPGQTDVRIVMKRPGTVRGSVVYDDGRPASGAWVWISEHRTDSEGRFEIVGLAPGRWNMRAWVPFEEDRRVTLEGRASFDLHEGEVIEDLRIVVSPLTWKSHVLVKVMDESGAPIDYATIAVFADGRTVGSDISDDAGMALVPVSGSPGTRVTVAASKKGATTWKSGHAEEVGTSRAVPPFPIVPVHIGSPGSLRLRIVDPAGMGLQRARQYVTTSFPVRSDGTYELPTTETFTALVRVRGCAQRTVVLKPPHETFREVTVRLVPAARLAGRLLGADGLPARCGMAIEAHQRTDAAEELQRFEVGRDGRFEIAGLETGAVWLRVYSVGTEDGDDTLVFFRRVVIGSTATVDLGDLRVPRRKWVQGLVTDGHAVGLEAAEVYVFDPGGRRIRGPTTTRTDGTFGLVLPKGLAMVLRVGCHEYGTRFVSVHADATEPLHVSLTQAGRVRVFAPEVIRTDRWWIRARVPGTEWAWEPREEEDVGTSPTSPARVYGDLPAGRVEIILETGLHQRARTINVDAGRTVDCVFEE